MAKKNKRNAREKVNSRKDADTTQRPGESPDEFRRIAQVLDTTAEEGLAGLADLDLPLSTGDLKEFPRPRPDLRAAALGLDYLREEVQRAVAILHALAAAREQGREVPTILRATVEPFIAAVRSQQ